MLIVLGAVLVVGCGDDEDEPTGSTTAIANPASVFCVEQGGTVEIVEEPDGQVGYCDLPDGTRVEEWEYYRSQNPTSTEPTVSGP